ncbi:hypothetical protein QYF61_020607 [Mycteria americana]|uniref:Uncharacterized protein n=1 Tax=Mycteria americana TaxID=33587 RepID=A0AAN7SJ00_MYCAM|nr:hypothetical protein QYF61_020607 [Mycteria americana]
MDYIATGHGCEDFEGMCCMNLSDHSESIHKQLRWLKEHANKIRQNQGFFDEWLTSLFGSLPSWLKGLLAEGLRLLIILVIIGLCFCVACSCVKKAFRTMINHAWIAQKQEGGIVEEWLICSHCCKPQDSVEEGVKECMKPPMSSKVTSQTSSVHIGREIAGGNKRTKSGYFRIIPSSSTLPQR